MIPQDVIAVAARLLREMPRNPTVIELDEKVRAALASQSNAALDKANKAPFDKKTYQRDLMRKRRAEAKAYI